MANRVTMNICGEDYTLVADEAPSYMQRVGALVDERMRELQENAHFSRNEAAVLAAVPASFSVFSIIYTKPAVLQEQSARNCARNMFASVGSVWYSDKQRIMPTAKET